jgi:hypothetical protein
VIPKIAIMEDLGFGYKHSYYNQRLAPGEFLYDDKTMKRLYESDAVNTQFLHSMYCEEYEKSLIEEMMQKRLLNGSVVLLEDTPK